MSLDNPDTHFVVVINHEEQYSIWPAYKAIPDGWRSAGMEGDREQCLAWIDKTWVDMRPLSLRQALQAQGQN